MQPVRLLRDETTLNEMSKEIHDARVTKHMVLHQRKLQSVLTVMVPLRCLISSVEAIEDTLSTAADSCK
jgi:hypothetical protein